MGGETSAAAEALGREAEDPDKGAGDGPSAGDVTVRASFIPSEQSLYMPLIYHCLPRDVSGTTSNPLDNMFSAALEYIQRRNSLPFTFITLCSCGVYINAAINVKFIHRCYTTGMIKRAIVFPMSHKKKSYFLFHFHRNSPYPFYGNFFLLFFTLLFMAPQSTTQFRLFFVFLSYFTNYTFKLVPTPE